jgi:hypothetical protein
MAGARSAGRMPFMSASTLNRRSAALCGAESTQLVKLPIENSEEPENIKETKSKFNWKEWRESHPLAVIGGVFIVAVTLTSACWSWFSGEHLMLAQEHAANELDKAKKELQAKIDDCNSRFSSIERHVGDRSFWDLSAMW